ncbi:hypothetical protein CC86DRAFT_46872 [Ophiobolus disseminans]|uniref:F-box domain-containing protein n=1 Tax=Ophiobolus disseminans TaxID=1469910 RepID=A0A6A6ZWC5_9PLEO|nr:hypothetical protein CC86DRAFT_46872 [Ophiobolus disseminans]
MTSQIATWADLPTEIKLEILRPCVASKQLITARKHNENYSHELVNYSLVSDELYGLALETYYKNNIFVFSRTPISARSPVIFHFPKAHIGPWFRFIKLDIKLPNVFSTLDDLFQKTSHTDKTLDNGSKQSVQVATDILALVRPRRAQITSQKRMMPYANNTKFASEMEVTCNYGWRHGRLAVKDKRKRHNLALPVEYDATHERVVTCWSNEPSRYANWQKHMTNLKHAMIDIQVEGCISQPQRECLQDLPSKAQIFLRAKKVNVCVAVKGCAFNSIDRQNFRPSSS